MTKYKSSFMQEYSDRGFFYQCTHEESLDELMYKGHIAAYIGFDCTATSLHVGSLMQIMILRMLQKHGHKPLVLVGGGTSFIGDPTWKDEARKLMDDNTIEKNKDGIKQVLKHFIKFGDGPSDAIMVDNADWLCNLKYIEFLRDYGQYFSVNRMLTMDNVKTRLEREQNLSFLEFNYMLLQSYDFLHLSRTYDCKIQFGGSDQWANIIMGVELNKRFNKETFGLTSPLLTTASGAKMGKTVGGAVWLTDTMYSPYDFWQYWRNTDDRDVGKFLRLFTDLPLDEIAKLEALQGQELNEAKKILATEVTTICHSRKIAEEAAQTAMETFEEGGLGKDLPEISVTKQEIDKGIELYKILTDAGLCTSRGEARKLIRGNGARINDKTIADELYMITTQDFTQSSLKLSAGKKRHVIVRIG